MWSDLRTIHKHWQTTNRSKANATSNRYRLYWCFTEQNLQRWAECVQMAPGGLKSASSWACEMPSHSQCVSLCLEKGLPRAPITITDEQLPGGCEIRVVCYRAHKTDNSSDRSGWKRYWEKGREPCWNNSWSELWKRLKCQDEFVINTRVGYWLV